MDIHPISSSNWFPDDGYDRLEIEATIQDLQVFSQTIMNKPWVVQDLVRFKEMAGQVVSELEKMQLSFSDRSFEYELLNRLKDKIQDFLVLPLTGLLSPGTTDNSPKELWNAIHSAFHGPWSIHHELKLLKKEL